ncbi:MAG: response regulator [Silicimonas sp.]|nr:response regulator [Silicimonas sp.]
MNIPVQNYEHADRPMETCLLVDDDDFDRSQMRRVVERQRPGVQIVEFSTLAEAREFLGLGGAEFVMLDNRLPDGLGAEFARELRENPKMDNVPIVVITNDDLASLDQSISALSKDDLSAASLGAIISEFLKARRIATGGDTAKIIEELGSELEDNLAPAFSRAIRTLRTARSQIMRTAPLNAIEALEQVEDILMAVSHVTSAKRHDAH